MEFIVNKDEIILKEDSKVHKGEYNATEFNFIFSEEYNDLIKKAIFENKTESIELNIVNNKCNIPSVMIESTENKFNLRVYGYIEENGNLIIRYSPAYITIPIYPGSYKGGAIPIPVIEEEKSVSYTENGEYEVIADEGYDGIAKTNISIDVQPSLETKSETITENGDYTYTTSTDYYGMSEVGINVNVQPSLETKNVSITQNGTSTVQTSQGYYGMSDVNLNVNISPNLQDKSVTINTNGSTTISKDSNYDGLNNVSLTVNVQPNLQDKSVTITENRTTTISKDSGYDGLGNVSITTNVPSVSDFAQIGYQETPAGVQMDIDYSKTIQQNFVPSSSMYRKYYNDKKLKYFPMVDTSDTTTMRQMFYQSNVETIPMLNTSKLTNLESTFSYCTRLQTIPALDTSRVTTFRQTFAYSTSLKSIPLLDFSANTDSYMLFEGVTTIEYLGGFKDYGKAFLTSRSENYSDYILNLSSNGSLTHDSLMNVINNLYDIKTKGCQNQRLNIGSTNYAKLTAEEIAIATNKGWNVTG